MIHFIDGNQLSNEVQKSEKLIIAEFIMPNSIPCNMQNDILKNIEVKYKDNVEIFKIDISEEQETKIIYGITSIPTTIFFKDNEELDRKTGLVKEIDIVRIIKDVGK